MSTGISLSSLIPSGLSVERFENVDGLLVVTASARTREAKCPSCGRASRPLHSRYVRQVSDLPSTGRSVRLSLITRRFRCDLTGCRRMIFAERFDDSVVAERARRTSRMECIVHHLGLALGGRPGACFAKRLMMPVSNDTLIRVVRRRAQSRLDILKVVGIDDFAFRRNHHYGSIVCDLERRRIVKLLPDREITTVAAWLVDHPEITVVSRDRGGGYGEATTRALPSAIQVADRWHLMENVSAAFLDAVKKSMKPIRAAVGATVVDPKLLTSAERLQYEGYLRREETNAVVAGLAADGLPIKEIVRRTGRSRGLVRQIVRGERTDVFRTQRGSLDRHLPFLDAQWEGGCRNGAELWRRLRGLGFHGSTRVVSEWTTRRRRSETMTTAQLRKVPSARSIARLMTLKRDHLTKAETIMVAAIENGVPTLDHRQRKETNGLGRILRGLCKSSQRWTIEINAERDGSRHGKPPFAINDSDFMRFGNPNESEFAPLGISFRKDFSSRPCALILHQKMHNMMQAEPMRTTVTLDDQLMERATALTGTNERGTLLRDALQALIERESARRLAYLGGSQTDLVVPPRRRGAA